MKIENCQVFGAIGKSSIQVHECAANSGIDMLGLNVVRFDNGFVYCDSGPKDGLLTASAICSSSVCCVDTLVPAWDIEGQQYKGVKNGCLVVVRPKSNRCELHSDWLGTCPIYFCSKPGLFAFGTKLGQLARSLRAEIDHVGVLEFLRNGYCVGDRTMFDGIRRLQPGQKALFSLHDHSLDIFENSPLWSEKFYEESEKKTEENWIEELWPLLTRSVSDDVNGSGKMSLMMSGGWDSRTLLAALDNKSIGDGSVFFHGDLASREAEIVKKLSGAREIDRYMQPITDECLDNQFLDESFRDTENVVFPHWHFAGRKLKLNNVGLTIAGIFGEVLGGHYGISSLCQGVRKAICIGGELGIPFVAQSSEGLTHEIVKTHFFESINNIPWYWNAESCPAVKELESEINDDIERAFNRLVSRGVTDPIRLAEAFVTEHRGSQYIAHQLLSIKPNVDISMPFADPQLMLQSTCIPSRIKIHNRLNRRILMEKAPELARYPMAATLVPASTPLVAQEMSRIVRKVYEKMSWILYDASRSHYRMPRLSWVNFTFLRESNSLQEVYSTLRSPIWQKAKLKKSVDLGVLQERKGSLHPLFDMAMKIATVDKTIDSLDSENDSTDGII